MLRPRRVAATIGCQRQIARGEGGPLWWRRIRRDPARQRSGVGTALWRCSDRQSGNLPLCTSRMSRHCHHQYWRGYR